MAQMAKLLSARQPVCTYQQSAYRIQLDALCNLAKYDRQCFSDTALWAVSTNLQILTDCSDVFVSYGCAVCFSRQRIIAL